MKMKVSKQLSKSDILSFEKSANQLRSEVALQLAKDTSGHFSEAMDHSHFTLYADKLPLSSRNAIDFNRQVTDTVIRNHVLVENDPYVVTFLGAKVVEQTFLNIYDPATPHSPLKNLSVAKHYGTFFTPPHIAEVMYSKLSKRRDKNILIDPCLGSGVLLAAPLIFDPSCPYNSLIGIELDSNIADWAQALLVRTADLTGYEGTISIQQGNGLEYLLEQLKPDSCKMVDVIINPPYGRLRITKDRATNAETELSESHQGNEDAIKELHSSVSDEATRLRSKYAAIIGDRGILEYSRLFFRACAEITKQGAGVSIISPDSWMSGSEGEKLRKFLLENRLIQEILLIREDSGKFATVNQSTSITILSPKVRDEFSISDFNGDVAMERKITFNKMMSIARKDLAIPRVTGDLLNTFERLALYTKFCEVEWVVNARGEIDQTSQKALFNVSETTVPLVRGEHIDRFLFNHSSSSQKPSFLNNKAFLEFIATKPKRKHFENSRLVGRQCSYAQQERRLIFCRVPAEHAVGNSCNYISVVGDDEVDAKKRSYLLLGLLNSAVLDWYFRIENSNNHVGNYEIDAFPFPSDSKWFDLIATIAYQLESLGTRTTPNQTEWLLALLEASVGLAYGLTLEYELKLVLDQIGGCNSKMALNYGAHLERKTQFPKFNFGDNFFNNAEPTLSDLDRLIISYVPEGGNWQSIPDSVPSERLKQIREMTAERGVVRTTYYGRLRRDQPAYTINTYFNRPGNGTHIHPILNRTLTSREAARLQSFPDSYVFLGSEGAVRDQIGNAVPPLLSAAIGQKFVGFAQSKLCVDIFCGAGGLSLGLESAGWHVLAAVDNNREALDTYCFNRPCDLEPKKYREGYTAVFKRDLHDKEEFENVVARVNESLNGRVLDMLVGGPPCQGFSHAGFRLIQDKRNDLASIYLHFAERLRPRIFILENVEGLMTFNNGQVIGDICAALRDLGYRLHEPVWKLNAEQYGAPQMRRRVFVVATLDNGIELSPPTPIHERCAGRRERNINLGLFDSSLPAPFTVADALAGLSLPDRSPGMLNKWFSTSKVD